MNIVHFVWTLTVLDVNIMMYISETLKRIGMATIKSFTDLSQSKTLSKILPLESADMHYCLEQRDIASGYEIGITPYTKAKEFIGKCNIIDVQPSWSLAALLSILQDYTLQTNTDGTVFVVCDSKKPMISDAYDNAVDACVTMIEKLNELNML